MKVPKSISDGPRVVTDLPDELPALDAELALLEQYLGDILGDLLDPERIKEEA